MKKPRYRSKIKCPCCGNQPEEYELSSIRALFRRSFEKPKPPLSANFETFWRQAGWAYLREDDWACDDCIRRGRAIIGKNWIFFDRECVCTSCGKEFIFPSRIQKKWNEEFGFDGTPPKNCQECSRKRKMQMAPAKRIDQILKKKNLKKTDFAELSDIYLALGRKDKASFYLKKANKD